MKVSSLLAPSALALACGLAVSSAWAFGIGASQEPAPAPIVRTEFDDLIDQMVERHGGLERIEAFRALNFDLVPIELSRNDEGEIVEQALEPLHCELDLGLTRRARLEETLEDKLFVKLAGPEGIAVFMDGEQQSLAELETVASEQVVAIMRHMDIVYGIFSGHLRPSPGRARTRDGVTYTTVEGLLAAVEGNAPLRTLLYVHPTERTVQRYDLYDDQNRRQATLTLSEFVELDGFPVATEITFTGRDREPYLRWRLESVTAPAEVSEERFLKP